MMTDASACHTRVSIAAVTTFVVLAGSSSGKLALIRRDLSLRTHRDKASSSFLRIIIIMLHVLT